MGGGARARGAGALAPQPAHTLPAGHAAADWCVLGLRDTAGSHPPCPNCPASASKWSGAKPQCLRLAPLTHLPQEYDCAMLAEVHGTFLWPRLAIKMQTQW